jgi:hypothetical protein
VKNGEPEYGPWLRVPSLTRRFRNIFSYGSGRSSPYQQDQRYTTERSRASETESDGVASSTQVGRQTQVGVDDRARSITPVNSVLVIDGIATARGSVNL